MHTKPYLSPYISKNETKLTRCFSGMALIIFVNSLLAKPIDISVKAVFFCRKSKQSPNSYLELKISVIANAISTALISTFTIWGIAFGILKHKGTFSNISNAKLGGLSFLIAFAASSLISGIAAAIVWHKHKDKALYEKNQKEITNDIKIGMPLMTLPLLPLYLLTMVYDYMLESIQGSCTDIIDNPPNYKPEKKMNLPSTDILIKSPPNGDTKNVGNVKSEKYDAVLIA